MSPLALAGFIDEHLAFLPTKQQKLYAALLHQLEDGRGTASVDDVARVHELARLTWTARRALDLFLESDDGVETFWEATLAAVRPGTALLLKRLRKSTGARTLDEALASSDAAYAIHEREEEELRHVRPEIRLQLWERFGKSLTDTVANATRELREMEERFQKMRELAGNFPKQEDDMIDKVTRLEDRVYIGGEMMALETIDAEMQFDREQLEIPPTDDALG